MLEDISFNCYAMQRNRSGASTVPWETPEVTDVSLKGTCMHALTCYTIFTLRGNCKNRK